MKSRNQVFRYITLGLQIIAIAAYFVPSLFMRSTFGFGWLVLGVIHTGVFCAVYFRDARRRTALSIILTIAVILYCLIFGSFYTYLLSEIMHIGIFSPIVVYFVTSLLAITFALAAPIRRQVKPESVQESTQESAQEPAIEENLDCCTA
ncbi:MAG: hypothetical protein FWC97_02560 [Treponema sp.]|nr:hypothetical protein [Treponema sp.]